MKENGGSWLIVGIIFAWIAVLCIIIDEASKAYLNPSKTNIQKKEPQLFNRPIDQETLEAFKRQLQLRER